PRRGHHAVRSEPVVLGLRGVGADSVGQPVRADLPVHRAVHGQPGRALPDLILSATRPAPSVAKKAPSHTVPAGYSTIWMIVPSRSWGLTKATFAPASPGLGSSS